MDIPFEVKVYSTDESFPENLYQEQIAMYLAKKKASAFNDKLKDNQILITADTIVWHNEKVLNKPADNHEALDMLMELSGNIHIVYTGVCIKTKQLENIFFDETKVKFRAFNKDEALYYIEKYKPFDKAGAYGAQDWIGVTCIEWLQGSYFNVMGLPTEKLYKELLKLGIFT